MNAMPKTVRASIGDAAGVVNVVLTSSDYGQFHTDKGNRDVTVDKRHRQLVASMKRDGWWPHAPMTVVKNGAGYTIKVGHHRFSVAQELGIPVCYQIAEASKMPGLAEIESTTKPWTLKDYITSHTRSGNTEYLRAREFAKKFNLLESLAFAWLWGEIDTSNQSERIRNGLFTIKDEDFATVVAGCYAQACAQLPALGKEAFAKALYSACRLPYFDTSEFLQRLGTHGGEVLTAMYSSVIPTRDIALRFIEDVWNRQRPSGFRKAIAFDATQLSKARQKDFGGRRGGR